MSLRKSHQVASPPLPFQVDEEGVHPEMKQLVLIDIHVLRPENKKFIKKHRFCNWDQIVAMVTMRNNQNYMDFPYSTTNMIDFREKKNLKHFCITKQCASLREPKD